MTLLDKWITGEPDQRDEVLRLLYPRKMVFFGCALFRQVGWRFTVFRFCWTRQICEILNRLRETLVVLVIIRQAWPSNACHPWTRQRWR